MVDSKLPKWAEPLLQGLSYWLGYKKQLYRHYPLSEGAIIGEALHLIYSNIGEGEKLECEVMYNMLNENINHMGNARADIVIKNPNDIPIHVIETKRSIAPNAAIIDDFKKLANAKSKFPNCHFYLLLVAQGRRPSNYVTCSVVPGDTLFDLFLPRSNYFSQTREPPKGPFALVWIPQ